MPSNPAWLHRLPEIRLELKGLDAPVVDRAVIEKVFAVRRRQAIELLHRFLRPLAKQLGLPWLGWHVFRHTASTLSEDIGMHLSDRQAQMGHSDVRMTVCYTHPDIDRRGAAVEALADRLLKECTEGPGSDTNRH